MRKGAARLINAIDPDDIRILTLAVKPGTALDAMAREGTFTMLSETEMVKEQPSIFSRLEGIHSKHGNYHAVNLLPELHGELPQDKASMLSTIGRFLALGPAEQLNFIFGRRQGYYSRITDLQQSDRYAWVQMEMEKFKENCAMKLEAFFHDRRKRWI